MNFLDFRKYFFANISSLWFYFCVFLYIVFRNTEFEPFSHNVFPSAKDIFGAHLIICFSIVPILIALTIVEALLRKYVIEKNFPYFKLNIKIKIPRIIVAIYNVIFSVGFLSASFLFFIAAVLSVLAMIMWLVNNIFS